MLRRGGSGAVRFATADSLEEFEAGAPLTRTDVTEESALEEELFLGLRLCCGVDFEELSKQYGKAAGRLEPQVNSFVAAGFLHRVNGSVSLTAKGRLLSNEVFERLLLSGVSS